MSDFQILSFRKRRRSCSANGKYLVGSGAKSSSIIALINANLITTRIC